MKLIKENIFFISSADHVLCFQLLQQDQKANDYHGKVCLVLLKERGGAGGIKKKKTQICFPGRLIQALPQLSILDLRNILRERERTKEFGVVWKI